MPSPPIDPAGFFDENIPGQFLEATIRCLCDSYRLAKEECDQGYERYEGHDLLPSLRRAKFDGQWRGVAARFDSLTASAESNQAKNCYHTCIQGGKVVLTASLVRHEQEIVRHAVFRETLARSNQVYFPCLEDLAPSISPDALLYAILIHGPALDSVARPQFAHVVFPSPDIKGYVARIRLEKRYPQYFSPLEDNGVENVADQATVEILSDITRHSRKSI